MLNDKEKNLYTYPFKNTYLHIDEFIRVQKHILTHTCIYTYSKTHWQTLWPFGKLSPVIQALRKFVLSLLFWGSLRRQGILRIMTVLVCSFSTKHVYIFQVSSLIILCIFFTSCIPLLRLLFFQLAGYSNLFEKKCIKSKKNSARLFLDICAHVRQQPCPLTLSLSIPHAAVALFSGVLVMSGGPSS